MVFVQRAHERGTAEHGWLHAKFSFSFADYFNPTRMGFGVLRVLNNDIIDAGQGFGTHPHQDMEIITIPLSGTVAHKDSTGVEETVEVGEVQVMSAGSGIFHSEYNHSDSEPLELFQIWIETKELGIEPRHEKAQMNLQDNQLQLVVSGNKEDNTPYIHQDAKINLGKFSEEKEITYKPKEDNGVFIMNIEGEIEVDTIILNKRDSIEINNEQEIKIKTTKDCYLMVIEVPMH